MKKRSIFALVLAVAIIAACSITAEARGFGPGHHKHGAWGGFRGMRGFLELKLSDAQQTNMLEIMDKYRDEHARLHDLMRKAGAEIRNAMSSEKLNEGALRTALKESSTVREEIFVLRARMKAELKAVLTPDQLRLLEDRKARFHKCRGKFSVTEEMKDQ